MTTTTRQRPPRLLRAPLILLLLLVVLLGVGRWWQVKERQRWLERATLDELAAAALRNEREVEVFERLGARAREAEQWPRAARAFQHACELAPDRVMNWVGWARTTFEFAGFHPADVILSTYIRDHPNDSRAYLERAALRRVAKRNEMAWADADKATRLSPKWGEAWALRGDLSLDQGVAGEATLSFAKARELMPQSAWAYVGTYQAYFAEKNWKEALDTARIIAERFPEVVEGKLYLAEALIEIARRPEENDAARKVLNELSKRKDDLRPMDQFAFYLLLGRTYFNQTRWREALPFFEQANTLVPDNPDVLFLLGRTYRALGDEVRAEATMTQHRKVYEDIAEVRRFIARINDNPNDAKARLAAARWYASHGIPLNAAIQYEEMIARGLEVETAKREMQALEQNDAAP